MGEKDKKEKKDKKSKKEKREKKQKKEKKDKKSKKEKKQHEDEHVDDEEPEVEEDEQQMDVDEPEEEEETIDTADSDGKGKVYGNLVEQSRPKLSKAYENIYKQKQFNNNYQEQLKDKELWFIQLPADVSPNMLDNKKVVISSSVDGNIGSVQLTSNTDDKRNYSIHELNNEDYQKFIPILTSKDKLTIGTPFTKSIKLVEEIELPEHVDKAPKRVNPEIKLTDLKLRWTPIGVVDKKDPKLKELIAKHHPFTKEEQKKKPVSTPDKSASKTKKTSSSSKEKVKEKPEKRKAEEAKPSKKKLKK